MQGLMTEREWRKQASRKTKKRSTSWGAQCILPSGEKGKLRSDKSFHVFLLLLSTAVAFCLPVFAPLRPRETFADAGMIESSSAMQPRSVSAISYVYPAGMETITETFTAEQLLRGKMLLIDDAHPLPARVPAPNTMSIAVYGKGMVPVEELKIKSGRDTIEALKQLFAGVQAAGVKGLTVWEGTLSPAQQRVEQVEMTRSLMHRLSPDQAVAHTLSTLDAPATGELQQEYTVELRFQTDHRGIPDERLFEQTPQGQLVLQTAWRFGFVRSRPEAEGREAFRFRWVGKAHATAMTYLDLSLEEYLTWLHAKGTLTITDSGKPKYVIVCKPMNGTHVAFKLPANASYEASLDNMGYALVACTIKE